MSFTVTSRAIQSFKLVRLFLTSLFALSNKHLFFYHHTYIIKVFSVVVKVLMYFFYIVPTYYVSPLYIICLGIWQLYIMIAPSGKNTSLHKVAPKLRHSFVNSFVAILPESWTASDKKFCQLAERRKCYFFWNFLIAFGASLEMVTCPSPAKRTSLLYSLLVMGYSFRANFVNRVTC